MLNTANQPEKTNYAIASASVADLIAAGGKLPEIKQAVDVYIASRNYPYNCSLWVDGATRIVEQAWKAHFRSTVQALHEAALIPVQEYLGGDYNTEELLQLFLKYGSYYDSPTRFCLHSGINTSWIKWECAQVRLKSDILSEQEYLLWQLTEPHILFRRYHPSGNLRVNLEVDNDAIKLIVDAWHYADLTRSDWAPDATHPEAREAIRDCFLAYRKE